MAPFYEYVCHELNWIVDDGLLSTMKSSNKERLKQLDEAIKDAESNLGETEIRDTMLRKAEYLSQIGDKVSAVLVNSLSCTVFFFLSLHWFANMTCAW